MPDRGESITTGESDSGVRDSMPKAGRDSAAGPLRGVVIMTLLLCLGLAGTALCRSLHLDLLWTSMFFEPGGAHAGWVHAKDPLWAFLYRFGEIPGIALAVGAAGLLIAAWVGKAPQRYRRPCLVVILTVLLGPGLLVNGILKNYSGRPRPADIARYGGEMKYREPLQIGPPGEGKSFPSGHASIAFALASAAAFYPFHPVVGAVALIGGILYGTLVGVARVAQGGHFPSDVLWSGVIVLMLTAFLYYVIFRIPEYAIRHRAQGKTGPEPGVGPRRVSCGHGER